MFMNKHRIKSYPVILYIVETEDGESDKVQIPFFEKDVDIFLNRYPFLKDIVIPNSNPTQQPKKAKPFSAHYFPSMTYEMCQDLADFVHESKNGILRSKSNIIQQIKKSKKIKTFLTPDPLVHEAMDTSVLPQIDIDHPDMVNHPFVVNLHKRNSPRYKSVRKGFYRYFIKVKDMPPQHLNRLTHSLNGESALELLCGQISYRDTSQPIENEDADIPEISYEELIETFPDMVSSPSSTSSRIPTLQPNHTCSTFSPTPFPVEREIAEQILEVIATDSTFNQQNNWNNVAYPLLLHFTQDVAFELFRDFSMTLDANCGGNKFMNDNWNVGGKDYNHFHSLSPKGSKTFKSLVFYAMNIDEERTRKIFPSVSYQEAFTNFSKEEFESKHDKMMRRGKNMIFDFCHSTVADLFCESPYSPNHKYDEIEHQWYSVLSNNIWYVHPKPNDMLWEIRRISKYYMRSASEDLGDQINNILDKINEYREEIVLILMTNEKDNNDKVKQLKNEIKDLNTKWKSISKKLDQTFANERQLGSHTFLTAVSNLLKSKLKENGFGNMLDSNPFLFAFEDGLVDLKAPSLDIAFRPITPEDKISKTCKYNYPTVHPNIRSQVIHCIDTMFLSDEMREYVWNVLALCCEGYANDKSFYVLTGEGDNGKSCIQNLMLGGFGKHFFTMKPATLCQKDSTTNDHSELPRTRGCRVVVAGEPSSNVSYNSSFVKTATGGDRLKSRIIYNEEVEWTSMFKLFAICNSISAFSQMDSASLARLRLICFKKQFKKDVSEEDMKNNPYLGLQVPEIFDACQTIEWQSQFMLILLERYFTSVRNKRLIVPKEVLANTLEYQNDHDSVGAFMSMNYRKMTTGEIENYCSPKNRKKDNRVKPILSNVILNHYLNSKKQSDEKYTPITFGKKLKLLGYVQKDIVINDKGHKKGAYCVVSIQDEELDDPYESSGHGLGELGSK